MVLGLLYGVWLYVRHIVIEIDTDRKGFAKIPQGRSRNSERDIPLAGMWRQKVFWMRIKGDGLLCCYLVEVQGVILGKITGRP
jgi:hypothetical protein